MAKKKVAKGKGFRPVHLLVCDDIRFEMRGKLTLVGAYSKSINVKYFPAHLRFGFLVEIQFRQTGPALMEFSVRGPDGKLVFEAKIEAEIASVAETSVMPIGPMPLAAPTAGEYSAYLKAFDVKRRVGTFKLNETPDLD